MSCYVFRQALSACRSLLVQLFTRGTSLTIDRNQGAFARKYKYKAGNSRCKFVLNKVLRSTCRVSVRSSNSLKLTTKVYRHSCNAVIPLFPLAIKLRVPANYKMPLDTVLCLDTSASMGFNNNEGINQLKAAARKFLEGVEETARQADLKVGLRIICNTLILHNYI